MKGLGRIIVKKKNVFRSEPGELSLAIIIPPRANGARGINYFYELA